MFKEEKTGLFIDGANSFSAAKALGFDIDYKKVMNILERSCFLRIKNFYTAVTADDNNNIMLHPLITWLQFNGFNVVTKEARSYSSDGHIRTKGNMDIEIAVDIMRIYDKLEQIILMSGDGDFRYLVEFLQKEGIHVIVISTNKTNPPFVADLLRKQANEFVDLLDLRTEISRFSPT